MKETAKETQERAMAVIRLAKALKSDHEKETKEVLPLSDFITKVYEKEPYKDFSNKVKKKVKDLLKFL